MIDEPTGTGVLLGCKGCYRELRDPSRVCYRALLGEKGVGAQRWPGGVVPSVASSASCVSAQSGRSRVAS